MQDFKLMMEDETRLRYISVKAKDAVDALLKAMKETGITNPTNVFQKAESGRYVQFSLQ
jgi:hypothetical protein